MVENLNGSTFPHHELTEKIQAVLVEALQVSPELVTADLTLGDIPQWDSMGHMEVMMFLEQSFGVEINNDTIANLTSIPAIRQHIQETLNIER
jgi:acyl carrier protein